MKYNSKQQTLFFPSWYFGKIGRSKAMHFLRREYNQDGAYLIRESEGGGFALSVKSYKADDDRYNYRHFKICHQGEQFFLHEK